jgi:hypothetical protein
VLSLFRAQLIKFISPYGVKITKWLKNVGEGMLLPYGTALPFAIVDLCITLCVHQCKA